MFGLLCSAVVGVYGVARDGLARGLSCVGRQSLGALAAVALAVAVLTAGGDVYAVDPTFPDILEPFSFTAMTVKIGTFLAVAMAAMAALVVGCILAKRLLNWVGKGV